LNGYAVFAGADEATVEALIPYIDWFASVCTDGAYRPIAPANPALSLTLRGLQFQIATASGRFAQALAVLNAWERDLQNTTDLHPEARALFTLQLHTHLAVNLDLPIEIGRAAASAQTLLALDPEDSAVAAIESPLPDGTPGLLDHLSPETIAEFLAFRCRRAPHLRDLLALTTGLDDPLRSAVVEALRERHALTMGIVGRVWSNESLEDVPDWDDVLDAFAVAVTLAREHDLPALLASAAVGQAIVHAEYLDAFDDAYDALDAADDVLPEPDPRVASYRAKAHGLQGHHEQALDLFEAVLPRWREVSDNDALGVPGSSLAYDFADAVRAAGRLGRYSDAARWAAMGAEAAESIAEFVPSLRLGYLADQALARALDDDLCGAVGLLVPVLDDLPPPDTPLLRKLYRRLSTLIAWLEERSGGRPFGFPTPELGQLSRTDEDEYPDVGLLPASSLWAALGEAERHAGCGTVVQSRARAERDGDSEPSALVAGFFSDLTDLVHDAPPNLPLRLARLTQRAQTHLDGDDAELTADSPSLADVENGTQTLIYIQALALTRAFAEGAVLDLPLTAWRTHAETVGADVGLVDEWAGVTVLAIAHVLGDSQATPHLWDVLTSSAAPALRWTASLAFAAAPADPVQHLQAVAFLTDAAAQPPFRPTVARAIATLADAEILPSDRDGIQAAARTLLDRPHASKLPLEMAVRIRDLAVGKDRHADPPLHGRL
jgi:tetratricopeptide (TPR) repeat protein